MSRIARSKGKEKDHEQKDWMEDNWLWEIEDSMEQGKAGSDKEDMEFDSADRCGASGPAQFLALCCGTQASAALHPVPLGGLPAARIDKYMSKAYGMKQLRSLVEASDAHSSLLT
ncbi:hypothetical protein NDU88_003360 [Pleurodeles waltl]|uniref:Uncharacterized protein n=1 Tax=Pleurodeles waltl TaxID=8319 RepID=A0AAV7TNE5_PLEWA|nr:hypothetical protein NDU88_003360 [Pleurodeles waltl]